MPKMPKQISVEKLKDVRVLYDKDIYELAQLLLKVDDAKGKATNAIVRHAVNRLASAHSNLADLSCYQIIPIFERHGLPLGATVEPEHDIASENKDTKYG